MINQTDHPVSWTLLVEDLNEAREHLADLVDELAREGRIDEDDYAVQLGHVFAHLNRCWNARALAEEIQGDQWDRYSSYPDDLEPVG